MFKLVTIGAKPSEAKLSQLSSEEEVSMGTRAEFR